MLHSQKCLFLHDEIKSDLFFSFFLIIYSFYNKIYMFLYEKTNYISYNINFVSNLWQLNNQG